MREAKVSARRTTPACRRADGTPSEGSFGPLGKRAASLLGAFAAVVKSLWDGASARSRQTPNGSARPGCRFEEASAFGGRALKGFRPVRERHRIAFPETSNDSYC